MSWGFSTNSLPEVDSVGSKSKFIDLALARFKLCVEAENKARSECLEDWQFSVGDQWPKDIRDDRNADGRPCLTTNRLPQFIRNVTNEQRQQRPAAQVNPVGNGADRELAEIIQGIVRHIEVQSDAEIAYDHAFECMVRGGFGWWRILTEYVKNGSKEQEIFIKRVKNPFKVYMDPMTDEPDDSDARFAFVVVDMDPDEYRDQYKESRLAGLVEFTSLGDKAPGWLTKDTIRVAEYFYIEGDSKFDRKIKWAKINAIESLEKADIPGNFIPLIRVVGDDLDIDGERHISGLVRHAKDPQRMSNYWESAATEAIALAPKAPWVISEGQIEDHEEEWRQSNRRNLVALVYKAEDANGKQVPPPSRNAVEPPIQAIGMMLERAAANLSVTTGLNDANLGRPKPDESGKAVLARQKQGDLGTLNFSDNLARSIRHGTRVLLSMIPQVYDTPRIMRIIKPDQSVSHVIIHNGADQTDQANALQTEAIQKIYDIGVGSYDLTVTVGPSFQSKRQEAVAQQLELLKILPPQTATAIMDIVVDNMDMPGAQAIADRLRKMVPPDLLDDESQDPKQVIQKLQAQNKQLSQSHDLLTKALTDTTNVIKEKQIEQQGKMQLEQEKGKIQILVAEIGAKAQESQIRLKMEMEMWKQLHGGALESAAKVQDHDHELLMTAAGQTHEGDMHEKEAAHDSRTQAAEHANQAATQVSDQVHQQSMAEQQAENPSTDS